MSMCVVTGKRTKQGNEDPGFQNVSIWSKCGWLATLTIILIIFWTFYILYYKSVVAAAQPLFVGVWDKDKILVENKRIGGGSFGDVYSGTLNGIKVAVKTPKSNPSKEQKEDFMNEINIMKNVGKHENIITFLRFFTRVETLYAVLEYASKGDLGSYLQSKDPPSSQMELLSYSTQVAQGMKYIHDQKIVHRDLASRNILVHCDHNNIIMKIADFGMARFLNSQGIYRPTRKELLPLAWTAPEGIRENKFTFKSDVFSFGVVLWEIFTQGRLSPKHIECSLFEAGVRLAQPHGCSNYMYKVMLSTWNINPDNRPDFSEIVNILSK